MTSLMNPDPKKRFGPTEALAHKFFSNDQTASVSSNYSGSYHRRVLSPGVKPGSSNTSSFVKFSSKGNSPLGSLKKIDKNSPSSDNWKINVK